MKPHSSGTVLSATRGSTPPPLAETLTSLPGIVDPDNATGRSPLSSTAQGSVSADNDGAELSTTKGGGSSLLATPLNLYQRLLAIQGEVDHIKATGKTAYNQRAISIEDVEDALGDLFQKHRVVSGFAFRERPEIAGAEGKSSLWLVDLNVWLVNPDDPKDRIDDRACDVGTSPSAGVSFAIKRYYKALFHLADEEDEKREAGQPRSTTPAADEAATKHLTTEQLAELDRLNKLCIAPVPPGLPWNSLVAGRSFEQIKVHLEARREQQAKPVKA